MASLKYKTSEGYVSIPMTVPAKSNAENGNGIGTCSTSSGTALTVSLTDYELVQNGFIAVTFANDVPANATLNINGNGAKPIIYKGSAIEADVIKADDTVMFAYDGTNYVVTSLGGGGGTIVWPEFVNISLTQSGGSDSDLIGATVVVTNDDTSAVILSTTWQGEGIVVQVDAGVNYTVTVGNVTGHIIRPNYQSYTAVSGLQRIISFKYVGDFVDFGLPSGTLWCTHNIGATAPESFGLYFSFGNIDGHNLGGPSTGEYNFDLNTYSTTPGYSLSADIPSGSSDYDAARANMGYPWRMPDSTESQELYDNTDHEWTTLNGVNGWKVMKKSDHNIFIFLPASSYYNGTTLGTNGYSGLRLRGYKDTSNVESIILTSSLFNPKDYYGYRYWGYNIRAVL